MPERSKDWLAQAERDLEQARWSLEGGFYEWVCFISQQSAEKAIKGLFQSLHAEAWGHSLSNLLLQLPEEMKPTEHIIRTAKRLDKLYIPPRYPNGFASGAPKDYYNLDDANAAINDAAQIVNYCKSKICR
jgi:HEPN domain-containing protein